MYQIIALYIFNLANIICQLYLHTARGELFTFSKAEGRKEHEPREGQASTMPRSGPGVPVASPSQWVTAPPGEGLQHNISQLSTVSVSRC